MTENTHEQELETLRAEIAHLRDELLKLTSRVKESVDNDAREAQSGDQPGNSASADSHSVWADILHKVGSSKTQGEKVVKDLANEVEQHPLVSILAAFGLGYIVAKLWYRGSRQ
jgi:hypothetical protein